MYFTDYILYTLLHSVRMTLTNLQKEVFFGEHEEYENLSDEEMEKRLKEIFVKYAHLLT